MSGIIKINNTHHRVGPSHPSLCHLSGLNNEDIVNTPIPYLSAMQICALSLHKWSQGSMLAREHQRNLKRSLPTGPSVRWLHSKQVICTKECWERKRWWNNTTSKALILFALILSFKLCSHKIEGDQCWQVTHTHRNSRLNLMQHLNWNGRREWQDVSTKAGTVPDSGGKALYLQNDRHSNCLGHSGSLW